MEDELTLISEDHRAQLKGFLQSKDLQTTAQGCWERLGAGGEGDNGG